MLPKNRLRTILQGMGETLARHSATLARIEAALAQAIGAKGETCPETVPGPDRCNNCRAVLLSGEIEAGYCEVCARKIGGLHPPDDGKWWKWSTRRGRWVSADEDEWRERRAARTKAEDTRPLMEGNALEGNAFNAGFHAGLRQGRAEREPHPMPEQTPAQARTEAQAEPAKRHGSVCVHDGCRMFVACHYDGPLRCFQHRPCCTRCGADSPPDVGLPLKADWRCSACRGRVREGDAALLEEMVVARQRQAKAERRCTGCSRILEPWRLDTERCVHCDVTNSGESADRAAAAASKEPDRCEACGRRKSPDSPGAKHWRFRICHACRSTGNSRFEGVDRQAEAAEAEARR